jgi:hypothetical protein
MTPAAMTPAAMTLAAMTLAAGGQRTARHSSRTEAQAPVIDRWLSSPARAAWCRQGIVAALAGLLLLAALVAGRRWSGHLDRELPLASLLVTAATAAGLAAAARFLWSRLDACAPSPLADAWKPIVGWMASAGLIVLAVGCCYPGARNVEWLVWLPLVVGDQFGLQSFFDGGHPERLVGGTGAAEADGARRASSVAGPLVPAADGADPPGRGQEILQQLFRVREPQGDEAVYGTVRADFAAGQRTATLHVGFCPPLAREPAIEAEPVDFPEARVKVVQALAHGARLDVRLPEAAEEPFSVAIDLAARPEPAGGGDSRCDAGSAAV